jgi:hypothetical protein
MVWALSGGTAHGVDVDLVLCVEEDWELEVLEPDPAANSPQVTCIISPFGDLDGTYAVFELNHRIQAGYTAGGMQLELWDGDSLTEYRNGQVSGFLHHPGEVVRWTQRMKLDGSNLKFEVTNGTSDSWGPFGDGNLHLSVTSSATSLAGYDPDVSVQHSGVGFASNRVARLVLKQVRYFAGDVLLYEDTTERVVHSLD